MGKHSRVLIILALFVLFPKTVSASSHSCTNEEKVYWKNLAQNVVVSYDAITDNNKVKFTITFSNLTKDLEIYDLDNQKWYSTTKKEYTINKSKDNKTYRFDIYTKDEFCGRVASYTVYASIPAYNKYQNDKLCKGIEEYKLCQKWASVSYDYDTWKSKVEEYRKSLIKDDNKEEKNNNYSILEKIVDVYGDIYYIVLPAIVIVGVISIYIYNKKRELF